MSYPDASHRSEERTATAATAPAAAERDNDELFATLRASYRGLVDDLTDELDLDTGAALVTAPEQHEALSRRLAAEMDLDAGVRHILGPRYASPLEPGDSDPDHRDHNRLQEAWLGRRLDGATRSRDGRSLVRALVLETLAELVLEASEATDACDGVLSGELHRVRIWLTELLEEARRRTLAVELAHGLLQAVIETLGFGRAELGLPSGFPNQLDWVKHHVRDLLEPVSELGASPSALREVITLIDDLHHDLLAVLVAHATAEGIDDHGLERRTLLKLWALIGSRAVTREVAEDLAATVADGLDRSVLGLTDIATMARRLPGAVRRLYEDTDQGSDVPAPAS